MFPSFTRLDRVGVTLGIIILGNLAPLSVYAAPEDMPASSGSAPASVAIVLTPSLTSVRTNSDLPQEQGLDSDRKLGWGGGVLFDAPMGNALSLGVGALYIQRKFQVGTGTIRLEREIPTLFIPAEAKLWMGNAFSIGGGVFGAFKVGDVTDKAVVGSGTLQSTTASDHETMEYGLTASANFIMPVAARTGLLVGARYLYGMKNGSKNAVYNEKIDDLALQAGLSFSL